MSTGRRRTLVGGLATALAVVLVALAAASSAGAATYQSSLRARYEFEQIPGGTVVVDSGPFALAGRIVNGTAVPATDPTVGRHLALDGQATRRYAEVPDHPRLDLNRYTLTAWVRYRPDGQERLEVLEKAGAYWMNLRTDAANLGRVRTGGFFGGCLSTPERRTWHYLDSVRRIPADTWAHLAATYDGSSLRLFVDGVLDSRLAVPSAAWGPTCANSEPLAIGAKHRTTPPELLEALWSGGLDDVRLYARALSGAQVREVMATSTLP